ncbi:peptide chain release factor N(5)-glutamine methyltransferase [Pseudodesulfovibrio sp.]|uniref:peptide chain release factor N(5)-glutamine methyltransferase n=1 Tax=Pseudodesulfovibrio sp. TaxID=2035812 RepID=UPI00263076DA|nr:peptide chain release factor N(5)-glutamine methyltransferase [Pseudodesulfovibrio sp.]MDD3310658.1 peptide chain release factor N(5)-glutamine methyltransferase [Pseudodesulfovibrio sp.]
MPTRLDILRESEARLAGVDSPRLSAQLLMAEVLGCSTAAVYLDRDREVAPDQAARIAELVARRAGGEPVAYILGRREFYGLEFEVAPAVLIPRPETEHIVERVETLFARESAFHFADLGTGSGILAVTIATLFPHAKAVAMDLSEPALEVARRNAARHGVADRIRFVRGDFTRPLPHGPYDLIVTNPPYVTEREMAEASPEVTAFEPASALVSGEDGLDHVRAMLGPVLDALRPGGALLMEVGWRHGEPIKKIMSRDFPEIGPVSIIRDLAGYDRVVFLRK